MKKKINFIDVIIIIGVVVVIAGAFWYFTKANGDTAVGSSNKVEITFVAEADNLQNDAVQQLKVGDILVSNGVFQDGKIQDIQISKSTEVVAIDGELIEIEIEELSKITVTIQGKANKYGPYVDLGGQEIKAGSKYYIKTDTYEVFGYVVQILEVKE